MRRFCSNCTLARDRAGSRGESVIIGKVSGLFRYPFKSMLGEAIDRTRVDGSGFANDRRFALVDIATGKIASAKLPHKWGRLVELHACCEGPAVAVVFPDGAKIVVGDQILDERLSSFLGRDVKVIDQRRDGMALDRADPEALADDIHAIETSATLLPISQAAPLGGFFDFAPIHIIPSASLARVRDISQSGQSDVARFRPNIVIDCDDQPAFAENGWTGATLHVGEVAFGVITPTPRCAIPTLAHGELTADTRLISRLGALNRVDIFDMGKLACLGVYTSVTSPGDITIGDEVSLIRP